MEEAKKSLDRFVEKGGYWGGFDEVGAEDVLHAVVEVAADIEAGKNAGEVKYGRQDIDFDSAIANLEKTRRLINRNREHGNVPKTSFSLMGRRGAGRLDEADYGGRMERNAIAEEMEKAGKDARAIKLATGWERGADGKWRYEGSDITLNGDQFDKFITNNGTYTGDYWDKLGNLVDDSELFTAYPELRDVIISSNRNGVNSFDIKHKRITLDIGAMRNVEQKDKLTALRKELAEVQAHYENVKGTDKEAEYFYSDWLTDIEKEINGIEEHAEWMRRVLNSAIVHEVQHYIQEKEGFAHGGSPNDYGTVPTMQAVTLAIEHDQAAERVLDKEDTLDTLREKYNNRMGKDDWESEAEKYVLVDAMDWLEGGGTIEELKQDYRKRADEMFAAFNDDSEGSPRDKYHKLAGETEARNVSRRLGMSPEERRGTLFEETEDVPRSEQVVRAGGSHYGDNASGKSEMSQSHSVEEFDRTLKKAKAEHGIVAPNLANRKVTVTGVPLHDFKGKFLEAKDKAYEWAKKNLIHKDENGNDIPITIHEGTQDEFTYVVTGESIKEFFNGSAIRDSKPFEKAAYLSIVQRLHEVIKNCIEVEVHPDYIEKGPDNKRLRDGKSIVMD